MLHLGDIALDAPFFQAGLAGYSDAAMRLIARRHGCPYAITEAMLDQFLIAGGKGLKAAELVDEDHPIAGQLMGSHPNEIAEGAKILVKLGYDVIDINLACPVKKIRKKARGGHLLQAPEEGVAILDAVRQAVGDDRPCTVKLRRGTDDSPEAERNFRRIFESVIELGYAGAVVHGRTVEQKYVGPARWGFLKGLVGEYGAANPSPLRERVAAQRSGEGETLGSCCGEGEREGDVRELDDVGETVARMDSPSSTLPQPLPGREGGRSAASWVDNQNRASRSSTPSRFSTPTPHNFVIGGSGDIWCAADIFRMIRETGVQLVSVARGCIGNPWVFRQARALMAGDFKAGSRPPTIAEQRDVLREHFELSVGLHGEKKAGLMMRKFGIKFSRHHPRGDDVKNAFIRVKNLADWQRVLDVFYVDDQLSGLAPTASTSRDEERWSCGV